MNHYCYVLVSLIPYAALVTLGSRPAGSRGAKVTKTTLGPGESVRCRHIFVWQFVPQSGQKILISCSGVCDCRLFKIDKVFLWVKNPVGSRMNVISFLINNPQTRTTIEAAVSRI